MKPTKKTIISVIVPIYNVEKYLDKCLDSLLNQTYENIEIICVEDHSPDNSREVLKKYKNNDKVKIIYNEKNMGLSYSRNVGIKEATGDYVGFVDSDDYISLDFYEKLFNQMMKDDSEIAIADIKIVEEANNTETISSVYTKTKDNIGFINNGLAASACNKLFKKELFKKYEFAVGKVNEDIAVIIPILAEAKKISYVEDTYYYYIQRGNSIQNSKFSQKRFDIIDAVDLTLERVKDNKRFEDIKDAIVFNQIIALLLYVIPKIRNIFERSTAIKKYYKLTKKYDVRNNKNFLEFLANSGKKYRLYYKMLFKLTFSGFSFLASMLIALFDLLRSILKRPVIKEYDDESIVDKAKKNASCSDCGIKISVVIPNYNYARFLGQRLDSILSQQVRLHEIIILDDCSKDNSKEVMEKYAKSLKPYIKVRTVYNEKNSGSAFKQWQKGFELATGDYVWIAEADDYCDKKLLKELVKPILKDNEVVISYADTSFIDTNGCYMMKTIKPEIDIQKSGHWNSNYINNGLDEIHDYTFLNCTIANVSSALLKRGDYSEYLNLSCNYKQAGDWLFYVNLMSLGKIAFVNKPLNYYRVHGNNVSSVMNKKKHLDEITSIYEYINSNFKLKEDAKKLQKDRIEFLKKAWRVK